MTRVVNVSRGTGRRNWREFNHGGLHGYDLRTEETPNSIPHYAALEV